MGLTPASDGNVIRLPIPVLTEERRKELVKLVKKFGEDTKVALRNIRREANEHLLKAEKEKQIPEDDRRKSQEQVQKVTDRHIEEVDKVLQAKEAEVMEV